MYWYVGGGMDSLETAHTGLVVSVYACVFVTVETNSYRCPEARVGGQDGWRRGSCRHQTPGWAEFRKVEALTVLDNPPEDIFLDNREQKPMASSSSEARWFFQRFDLDGDNMLDLIEFGEAIDAVGLLSRKADLARMMVTGDSPQTILAEMRAKGPLPARLAAHADMLKAEFAKADADADGVVSYDEWERYYAASAGAWRVPFDSTYEVRGVVGRGAFGTVQLGVQRSTGRRVAVKHLEKRSRRTASHIHAEIAIWEGLRHPHLLELLSVHETGTGVLLVTEYMEGGDLFHAIERASITELQAARLARQLLSAVSARRSA